MLHDLPSDGGDLIKIQRNSYRSRQLRRDQQRHINMSFYLLNKEHLGPADKVDRNVDPIYFFAFFSFY